MSNSVRTLVVSVVLMGCHARGYKQDVDPVWPPNRTLAPIILKDDMFPGDQDIPVSTLSPVQPKVVEPPCNDCASLEVPAGDSVSFTSPTTPANAVKDNDNLCGWQFKTVPGSTFTLTCESFSLSEQDSFYVNEYSSSLPLVHRFSGQSFPSSLVLNATTIRVVFLHEGSDSHSHFSCTIAASGGTPSPTNNMEIKAVTTTPCKCGIVNRTTRIVGGINTQENEYPWQVGFMYTTSRFLFCGGALINDRYIVTAAHCMKGRKISSFRVLLGGHTKDVPLATEKIVKPLSITNHRQYNVGASENNDISLIKITPLVFSTVGLNARPICLPNSADLYAGVMATTTGWGTLSVGGAQPNILQEVNIPIVTNAYCASVYGTSAITSNMICAGTDAGGTDSCQGDSGGPLIAPDGVNYELIGVVSFGSGCGDPGVPGVYARVSALQSWIVSKVVGSTTCGR